MFAFHVCFVDASMEGRSGHVRSRRLPAHLSPRRGANPAIGALDVPLTNREQQIVAGLLRGLSNHDIARHLRVRPQTIKNQLTTLYRKLRVSGRVDLVRLVTVRRL